MPMRCSAPHHHDKPNPVPGNKELLIIPDANHCDLYDGGYTEPEGKGMAKNMIPWDKIADFIKNNVFR